MSEERKEGISGGIRTGVGILTALKDVVEETINEARERGDLSTDKARSLMQDAMQRLQNTVGETRERLDFASRREFDEMRAEIAELRGRVSRLEGNPEAETDPKPDEPTDSPGFTVD
jgi:polyhydroxyalkanoate synthesis regulator phasin